MTGVSLGALLKEAGIKGAKPASTLTLKEARALSKKVEESHPHTAVSRLPANFDSLRQCRNGREFLKKLYVLISEYKEARQEYAVTEHVVFGIVQLAHDMRDVLSGSKRSSFTNVAIPKLMGIKERALKNACNLASYILETLKEFDPYHPF